MSSAEIAVPVVPPFAESFVLQLESWGDYCNPIVVKEVRQALKSAMFLGAFVLCLFFCWIATCCGQIGRAHV